MRWSWMAMAMAMALALSGCDSKRDSVYCVLEVREEDQGQGMTDQGVHNPDLVGQTICWGDLVTASYCEERNGTWGSLDDYEGGSTEFCAEQGFPVDCGGGLFMPTEADCPADEGTSEG